MKKQLYILITVLACISFIVAGCGSGENKSKAADTASTASTQTKAEFGQATQKQKEAGKKFVREIRAAISDYVNESKKLHDELEGIKAIEDQSLRDAKKYDFAVKRYNLAVKYYKKCDEFSTAGMEDINHLLAERCRLALQQFFQNEVDEAEFLEKIFSGQRQLSGEEYNSEIEHFYGLRKRYYEEFCSLVNELEQDLQ